MMQQAAMTPYANPTTIVDGIRWHFAPQALSAIDPKSLCLADLLRSGQAKAVKDGLHRTVYRIDLPGGTVYYKRCKLLGIRGYLRQCLRPPKAKMEFDRALTLRARGIATIEPLAWGVQAGRIVRESFLITRALPEAVPLARFFQDRHFAGQSPSLRHQIALELGRFLALLHQVGIAHPDLHAGNLLFSMDGDRVARFFLIDLHNIKIGSPLGWKASRENLILLNRWAQLRTSYADRSRFMTAYFAGRPTLSIDRKTATRELESGTAVSNFAFWNTRDRRSVGTNRYFRRVNAKGCSGHSVREIDEAFLQRLLTDPDAPFREPNALVLKNSRSGTVIELEVPTPDGPQPMIYKRFRRDRWYDRITPFFYRAPALRSWVMGHALQSRDLPTPRPWLILHRRSFGLYGDGYLLCEKVPDARDLHAFVRNLQEQDQFRQRKWDLIDKLAHQLRRFHERFVSHRDLKAANILASETLAAEIVFSFIDLVGVRATPVTTAKRIENLSRLHASFMDHPALTQTDKLRFLRAYMSWGLQGQANWKHWWLQLKEATWRKRARNARRGRPLS